MLELLKKNFLFLFIICSSFNSNAQLNRLLYVDDFHNIMLDTCRQKKLLLFADINDFNTFIFFRLPDLNNFIDLTDPLENHVMAEFIRNAKENYGIEKVIAAGDRACFFENVIIQYNQSRQDNIEKIDGFGMEFEFWTDHLVDTCGYYCLSYLLNVSEFSCTIDSAGMEVCDTEGTEICDRTIPSYCEEETEIYECTRDGAFEYCLDQFTRIRELTDESTDAGFPMTVDMFFGWPDNTEEVSLIADTVNRTYISTYRSNPTNAADDVLSRLQYYDEPNFVRDIIITFSAESAFMGEWFMENGIQAAEDTFIHQFDSLAENHPWGDNVNLQGFAYFAYTRLVDSFPSPLYSVSIDSIVACNSYTWIDGVTYTESIDCASYIWTDSTGDQNAAILNLTINPIDSSITTIEACNSYTWIDSITYTESNNSATFTLVNEFGCDSIVILNLNINLIDTSVTVVSETDTSTILVSNAIDVSYQWMNCDTDSLLPEATDSSFMVLEEGSYAVIINDQNCVDISECVFVGITSDEYSELGKIQCEIFPNPTSGDLYIDLGINYSDVSIKVKNISGQIVLDLNYNELQYEKLNILGSDGVYFVEIKAKNFIPFIFTVVKN